MPPRLDLTGININGLTFIERTNEKAGSTYKWIVECHCGVKFITNPTSIKLNKTLSCGCSRKNTETLQQDFIIYGMECDIGV